MKKIFISHRSTDAELINELVQYLENIGIKKDEIMYTSADSCGVQYDLGTEIKQSLNEAEKFIVILSNSYYESIYCCNELGYIWATDKTPIIFGLAGIDSEKDYQGFVNNGWFIRRLNNPKHIDFLFQEMQGVSQKHFTSPVKPNEYKDMFIHRINDLLEKKALNKQVQEKERYSPEKIIDLDSLIERNYYSDKEMLFFKYLLETNNYVCGTSKSIQEEIISWEKQKRIRPFLSKNLEEFLIMLTQKNYLISKIITKQEFALQGYCKDDPTFKMAKALFQADENGNTKHNFFLMDERLFRVIVNINKNSQDIINKAASKHILKWYQKYPHN